MFVTMLGRMMGVNTWEYTNSSFRDVPTGRWDTSYVTWASNYGIVNGIGNNKFDPDGIITMEQYCAIMCRLMDQYFIGYTSAANTEWPPVIANLKDASSYARNNIKQMVELGLTEFSYEYSNGYRSNVAYIEPKKKLNRAWIAEEFGLFYVGLYGNDYDRSPTLTIWLDENHCIETWVEGLWADGE